MLTGVGGHRWRASAEQIAERVTVHVTGERGGLWDPNGDWASRSEVDHPAVSWYDPTAMSYGAAPPPDRTGRNSCPTPSSARWVRSRRLTCRKHPTNSRGGQLPAGVLVHSPAVPRCDGTQDDAIAIFARNCRAGPETDIARKLYA